MKHTTLPPVETYVPTPSIFDRLYPARHNEPLIERMYAPQKSAPAAPPKNPRLHRFYIDGVRNGPELERKGATT